MSNKEKKRNLKGTTKKNERRTGSLVAYHHSSEPYDVELRHTVAGAAPASADGRSTSRARTNTVLRGAPPVVVHRVAPVTTTSFEATR